MFKNLKNQIDLIKFLLLYHINKVNVRGLSKIKSNLLNMPDLRKQGK